MLSCTRTKTVTKKELVPERSIINTIKYRLECFLQKHFRNEIYQHIKPE